jgi:glutathione S-transferase
MKLYEFGPTRSIRARWTLQELGVEFEAIPVNLIAGEHQKPDFLKLNPAGKVPVLVDGEMVLTESVAIVRYLGEKYPEKRLVPSEPKARAQLDRWLLFTATELEQPLWRITKHTRLYPEEKRLPAEVELARADFQRMAPVMDAHLEGREFVLGNQVSVGDFVLAYTLDWADMLELLMSFPRLKAYMERMYKRPHAALRIREAFAQIQRGAA